MTEFEKGFVDELEKISASVGLSSIKPPKVDIGSMAKGVSGGISKPLATAMRSPLSLITAMKPPKQTFYTGK